MIRSIISSNFSDHQLYVIIASLFLGAVSIYFFQKEKFKLSITLLFFAALFFRLLMADIDPFLHTWDEQYHALVAKNMIAHPFTPMLYTDPVMKYDFHNWSANHIWVHKQPLFLWLMAASMKIFGVNEFAARIPSALMLSLMVFLIFRMGTILFDKRTGFTAAFLCAFMHYQLQLATGYINTDHNDIAFMFFITCSFWSYLEFTETKNRKWIFITGIFCGCAMLVKWVLGLMVLTGWSLIPLLDRTKRGEWFSYVKDISICLFTALVIFIPWQIYTFLRFPEETKYVMAHNSRHFTEAMDGHDGTIWYHINLLPDQYGFLIYLLPLALFMVFKGLRTNANKIAYFTWLFFVYIFFAIAQTKMPLFCIIAEPLIFIALGLLVGQVLKRIGTERKWMWIISSLILFSIAIFTIEFKEIENDHTDRNKLNFGYRKHRTFIAQRFTELGKQYGSKLIVYNCEWDFRPMIMFYSDFMAYKGFPDQNKINELLSKGYKVAVIEEGEIPEFISSDQRIIKLKLEYHDQP